MSTIKLFLALCTLVIALGVGAAGPPAVNLGTAGNYAILAKTGVSTVPSSAVTGAIGVSPVSGTYLTGFSSTQDSTDTFATSLQVVGRLYAANFASPTPSQLTTAVLNMGTAYTDGVSRVNPDVLNLGAGTLTSKTLVPGLYKWTSGVSVPTDLTFSGSSTDTWILQISGTFVMASSKNVILIGGALAKNIVWVIAGTVDLGANAHFEGIVLTASAVTLGTGSSMNGRVLTQTMVALQKAIVVQP